jgi:hypothetical protein
MNENVSKFPVSHWQRILNRRGSRAVHCVVSGRYMRFGRLGAPSTGYFTDPSKIGTPVVVDIMSDTTGDDDRDRKLCHLVVTLEELKQMVSTLEGERTG